jgi:hypothetical protein
MLFTGADFLSAGGNFLNEVANFLFAGFGFQVADEKSARVGLNCQDAAMKFMLKGLNSLSDVGKKLSDGSRFLLFHSSELQFAYLFELWACRTENRFHIFLYITCNVHQSACGCIKNGALL